MKLKQRCAPLAPVQVELPITCRTCHGRGVIDDHIHYMKNGKKRTLTRQRKCPDCNK